MENNIKKISSFDVDKTDLIENAKDFANYAYAENTLISYKKDWKNFCLWCNQNNLIALPSSIDNIILYITNLANIKQKASTIERKIYSIRKMHQLHDYHLNFKDSRFILVYKGIKRKIGTAKVGKAPLLIKQLREVISVITEDSFMSIRDRAIISFGFASAMRRSEIIDLNWSDIEFIDEGMVVTINRSKTDKYGVGQKIAIIYGKYKNTCAVTSIKKLKSISDSKAVFTSINKADIVTDKRLSSTDIARIIKKRLINAGIDPTDYGGHSLRSGFITTAAKNSVPDHIIMKHSRHKTIQMLKTYTRDNSLINDNATSMIGL
ncbi:MAG: hypothetical protein EOP34_06730 [Rickettsiales bacterium]|nr:MAG: hypothetical protein EOP34_06730 [Rickettsiales bacterium]